MMKTKNIMMSAALLFAIGSTSSFAGAGHEHASDKHAGDKHAGGHMGHMNDVLQRLKRELGSKYDKPVPAATKQQLATGKKIFSESCTACHGEKGKGNGPAAASLKQKPADFTDAEHSKFYSDQGRLHIIKKGSAGTAMSAWEGVYNEQEILSVHAYIRSLRSPAKKESHGHGGHTH